MRTITVHDKTELTRHASAIETLFLSCFGDKLSVDLWRWAYLDNPNGEPIVTLCYDDEALVGHYAAIPVCLTATDSTVNAFLSMTTMVAATHRQHGLFVSLAQQTYQQAAGRGIDCVIGFPNAMSAPGFRKRLNWSLPDPDFVATVTKTQLLELMQTASPFRADQHRVDFGNGANRAWRLSKPATTAYRWDDGLVYKPFDGGLDLLAFDTVDQLQRLPEGLPVNVLVPAGATNFHPYRAFDYQFGGIGISRPFDPARIARQMALSDVF